MNQEQWLEWRRAGIGSSDAAIIMGVSPWRTPHQLWQEKVYGDSVQLDNSSMKRGRELEPVARSWLEKTMNVTLFPQNIVHQSIPWVRASLDGIDMENRVAVEIKWPNKEDHAMAMRKEVPPKYIPQVQHQLLVTGLDKMYYCSFDWSYDGAIVEVARDNAYIKSMLEEEQKFWDLVLAKKAPELTDRDYVDMQASKEWRLLEKQWLQNKKSLDSAEEQDKEIRKSMIDLCGDRNAKGNGMKICKSVCEGAVDWQRALESYQARLTALFPGNELPKLELEAFRKKPFTKWTFRDTSGNQ